MPENLPGARVLITVKTYPLPASAFGDRVCTAGLLEDGKWIRIYPVIWDELNDSEKYAKYNWIELDLIKNKTDFRPETYSLDKKHDAKIQIINKIDTKNAWAVRKRCVLKEIFTSMSELIDLAMSETGKSLATLKPKEIIDFSIEIETDPNWKPSWVNKRQQMNIFNLDDQGAFKKKDFIKKLPYRFSYKFITEGDKNPRKLSIQDWEIGALFWNCLKQTKGDDEEAKRLVRSKYFDEFKEKKDLYLFLGTDYKYHRRKSPDPFIIIGVFYPPKVNQPKLIY